MEKYYLILKDNNPYCIQACDKLCVLENNPIMFWGEHTREEESYDLSIGLRLFDVFSDYCGGKVRVVGTII